MASKGRILVVDDEEAIRFGIRRFLLTQGFEVEESDSCVSAEVRFRALRPDVAILDLQLPDGSALQLLPRLKAIDPSVPLIILTGQGSIDLAVRAIKEGAEQFLTKPVELPALAALIDSLLERQRSHRKELAGRSRRGRESADPFFGSGPAIAHLAADARRVLQSDSPVVIFGETGAGKGVLARWIHDNGPRAEEAFVDLNCAGFSRDLLDSELFGHDKGAFTGAVSAKPGLLEIAHRGSLFLDEIGDMDRDVQAKLLKVLEDGRFRRLGDTRERSVDVRLIAATHQDLEARIQEGQFRQDLYFRINTLPLWVPALRERREDIPALAREILRRLAAEMGRAPLQLATEAEEILCGYRWPGNVRELRNVLERALLLAPGSSVEAAHLRFEIRPPLPTAALAELPAAARVAVPNPASLAEIERSTIERALRDEKGHVARAAARLGIPRSSLYDKLKRFKKEDEPL